MHWMPRQWTLVGMLLAAVLTMAPVAPAQVTTTQIADTIYRADGSAATGTVIISWPAFLTASGQSVQAGSTATVIAAGGVLNVQLAPNAGSNPMGSYYTVVYHLDDGSQSRQYWVVPTSGSAVKVAAISSTVMPLSVAQQTASVSYVNAQIASLVATGTVPQGTGSGTYVQTSGDTMTGPLVLPGDPTTTNQAADKHYVDVSVQQVAAGVAQKVSLIPQANQLVAQPVGSQMQVNKLNGAQYATEYVSGQGNNGIANAVAGPDCVSGCDIRAEDTYNSLENYSVTNWNSQTHLEDLRLGAKRDTYMNPGNPINVGIAAGQLIDMVTTQQTAVSGTTVVNGDPEAITLEVSNNALAGGSNLYPASIEGAIPYFKSTYIAQQITGNYNTMGQHSLTAQNINCYGVGDCLIGSHFMVASGGFRDEADEGAHPFDLEYREDSRVFTGTCSTGCSTNSTSILVATTAGPGTQGEGRFLINKNPAKVISAGLLTGGTSGAPYPTAIFSGVTFPLSTFFATAALAPSQVNTMAPGTVVLPIATTGVTAGFATNTAAAPATSGVACVVDQDPVGSFLPHNYEMANYTVVDGTHLRLTLNKVHAAMSTVAIGGLCGYGLEETVDTQGIVKQVFPVVGSNSSTTLYYAGGLTPIVGVMNQTGGFLNIKIPVVAIARTSNVVTITAANNFAQDINGLQMTVAGVTDSSYNGSFTVTTTSPNTFTYPQVGPNSTSLNGSASILTGGFALYPMAEVLGVLNPATKALDGSLTLAPNTVAWAANDAVEEPHYYQERLGGDAELISQIVPRPTTGQSAGISYQGNNSNGLIGYRISNDSAPSSYLGAGGNHLAPDAGFMVAGTWRQTMELDAGQDTAFYIHCNYRGCNRWNSGYQLFAMDSAVGADTVNYQPNISTMTIDMRGQTYQFSPLALTAQVINVGTLNASSYHGPMSGNNISSGAVAAAFLPMMGASGSAHAAGIAPDPGQAAGNTRFLREDGTWSTPGVASAPVGNLLAGATADYNFLQGSGTTITDSTGNGNSGTFLAGAAPSWTPSGLAFVPTQGVTLPAALNGTQTYFLGLYVNPLTAGTQPLNQYPVLLSSTTGSSGFNFMYGYAANLPGNNFIPFAYAPTLFVNGQKSTMTPNLVSGFHVLAAVLGSSGSGVDHIYIDGVEVANYTAQGSSASAETSGNLVLGSSGASPWQNSGINGTMYRLRTYPTQLSAASVLAVSAAITNEVAARGVAVTPVPLQQATPQLQAIGDSITFGQGVTTPWPSLLTLSNQPAYTVTDWGISGITLTAINGSDPNRAALHCHTSSGPSLAVVFAGTNDFGSAPYSAAGVLMNLLGEVQTIKQAGCKVFVGTMLSRGSTDVAGGSFDADKDAYDALILAQAKAGGADGIMDFAANPLLGADGANAGASFQADHIHPTQAGQQLLANVASNVLNYTFGYNETNPHVVTSLGYTMTAGDGYVSLAGLSNAGTLTLPDCTGQSGASYRINNPQSAFAVSVVPLNANQLINGLTTVTAPANATLTLRDTPNPKTVSGCHWEM